MLTFRVLLSRQILLFQVSIGFEILFEGRIELWGKLLFSVLKLLPGVFPCTSMQ